MGGTTSSLNTEDPDDRHHDRQSTTTHQIAKPIVDKKIYLLYQPEDGVAAIDIVFFHGLQLGDYTEAYTHTWESDVPAEGQQPNRRICWPREWLGAQDFPTARILSICYDSKVVGNGKETLRDIVKGLLFNLIIHADVGQKRPVILIGHSLGGLVIKKMCVEAFFLSNVTRSVDDSQAREAREFLQNTLGAFFYATPHAGAPLAEAVKKLDIFKMASPVLQHLANPLQLTELKEDFNMSRRTWSLTTYGLGEVKPFRMGLFNSVVVPPESSRDDIVDSYVTVDIADHCNICKPDSKAHPSYKWITKFVQRMLDKESNGVIDRPYRAVRGLSDPDKMDAAIEYIEEKSYNQEIAKKLLEVGVMRSIMGLLASDQTSSDTKVKATWALDNLADNSKLREVKLKAGEAGAIELLVRNMLNDKKSVYAGVYCIRVLIYDVMENRRKLRRCGPGAENLLEGLNNRTTITDYVDDHDWAYLIKIGDAAREVLEYMHDA